MDERLIFGQPVLNNYSSCVDFLVLGCGEFLGKAPEGGRIRLESGRRVTVFCTEEGESGDSFELVCDGRRWRGERRNCTDVQTVPATSATLGKIRKQPFNFFFEIKFFFFDINHDLIIC